MAQDARQQLLHLIDRKVFSPILETSPERYSGEQRRKFEDVRKTTASTRERYYRSYESAEAVRDNFRDDLSSDAGRGVQKESRALGLPTLQDIKGEVEQLADGLGVGR